MDVSELLQIVKLQIFIIIALAVFFLVIFVAYLISKKRDDADSLKKIINSQEKNNSKAAELLSQTLFEYTENNLVEQINEKFSHVFSDDLLPAINTACSKICSLSESVVEKQEKGMEELATMLADLLAEKTREYIRDEEAIVLKLKESVSQLSSELSIITDSAKALHEHYDIVYQDAEKLSLGSRETLSQMTGQFNLLSNTVKDIALLTKSNQDGISQNIELISSLSDSAAKIQENHEKNALALAAQNEEIAKRFSGDVTSLQNNTQLEISRLLTELKTSLEDATGLMTSSVKSIENVSHDIHLSADNFNSALANTYENLGSGITADITKAFDALSDAVETENNRLVSSAEAYNSSLTTSVSQLTLVLESHIASLSDINRQINGSISAFKRESEGYSSRFELGMESSIESALNQIDTSLAEIVSRLITVTDSIQEAADALPSAVKSLMDSKR